jgi:hypothetical protein
VQLWAQDFTYVCVPKPSFAAFEQHMGRLDTHKVFLGRLHVHCSKEAIKAHLLRLGLEPYGAHMPPTRRGNLAIAFVTFLTASAAARCEEVMRGRHDAAISPSTVQAGVATMGVIFSF